MAGLSELEHVVVLMMENRSFDHMLGYLKGAGMGEVEGLDGTQSNPDDRGQEVKAFEFGPGETAFHRPGQKFDHSLDPCHSAECIARQLEGGNQGFLKNFIAEKKPPDEYRNIVMGHYTGEHLPVYDHLARNFHVCDHWFSSVPDWTWANRVFAITGKASPQVHPGGIPDYDLHAFTRELKDDHWRWYSHDPGTLRAVDKTYRNPLHLHRDNFAYFNKKKVSLVTRVLEKPLVMGDSFLDDVANGELRQVSWIDPNFVDVHVLDPNSDDDHPPSDVLAGQQLVLDVYEALVNSEAWEKSMLVITYDEHGGFYDHVEPPAPPEPDPPFPTYGVRVPALVVSPLVKQGVSHTVFDHTSLIKTILMAFGEDAEKALSAMPPRVALANDLGELVTESTARTDIEDRGKLRGRLEEWRTAAKAERMPRLAGPVPASDGAGLEMELSDFQDSFMKFALEGREKGWAPPGHP